MKVGIDEYDRNFLLSGITDNLSILSTMVRGGEYDALALANPGTIQCTLCVTPQTQLRAYRSPMILGNYHVLAKHPFRKVVHIMTEMPYMKRVKMAALKF